MRLALPLAVLAAFACPAQEARPTDPAGATVPAPASRSVQRATTDLHAAAARLAKEPHTFTGACWTLAGPNEPGPIPFRGALGGGVEQLWCQNFHVLRHGEAQLVRAGDGAFQLPQGDAPDPPLPTKALAVLLPASVVQSAQPAAHGDRPAMTAHVQWSHDAAAALCDALAFPSAKKQAMLERFSDYLRKPPAKHATIVDAIVRYDPARRQVLAVTLRVAMVGTELPPAPAPDEAAPPMPAGLPALAGLRFAFLFDLVFDHDAAVSLPQLDAAQRAQLGLPPAPPPPK